MTQFFVDAQGAYLGGFDGAEPPDGAIEVLGAPAHGDDRWIDGAWASTTPTVPAYTAAIQSMLDAFAQERHYDNILSACTYATSTVSKFRAEGQACVDGRDAVWAESYSLMAQVEAGTLAQPTIPALLAMLPAMAWPA